jgi:hypothetical protein
MDDFTRALDSLLRVIVLLGDLIVARIQVIELWIRMRFDSWGLPPQVQTALLVTAAVVVLFAAVRLFGVLVRVVVILLLLLIVAHIAAPMLGVHPG